jgi:hypothetical protein
MDFHEINTLIRGNPYGLCCMGVDERIDLLRIQKQKV